MIRSERQMTTKSFLQAAVNAFLNESPSRTRGEKRSATGIDPSSGPSVEPKNGWGFFFIYIFSNLSIQSGNSDFRENKEWLAKRPNLGASPPRQQSETDVPDSSPSTPSSSKHATEISAESNPDISKRSFFKLMSWNIDGNALFDYPFLTRSAKSYDFRSGRQKL